jgi:hypothetical protein
MSASPPTDPAPRSGRRASRATTSEYPSSHRAPDETDEIEAPNETESGVEDLPEEAPRSTKRRGKIQRVGKPRWLRYAPLAIAVIALAVAIVALFHPVNAKSQTFNAQQTADAKTNLCSAYTAAHQAVVINTHLVNPRADDPIGPLAVAANARLALLGGGAYLRDRVAAEPAAPADLAKTLTYMADTIEQLGINYLAGASNLVQDPLRNNLDKEIRAMDQLCA